MIIEEVGIDINKIQDVEDFTKLVQDDPSYVLFDSGIVLSSDNLELVSSVCRSDFSVSRLSPSQIQRLNEYHDKFMKDNIYPQVTNDKTDNNKVIKLANRISKIK